MQHFIRVSDALVQTAEMPLPISTHRTHDTTRVAAAHTAGTAGTVSTELASAPAQEGAGKLAVQKAAAALAVELLEQVQPYIEASRSFQIPNLYLDVFDDQLQVCHKYIARIYTYISLSPVLIHVGALGN